MTSAAARSDRKVAAFKWRPRSRDLVRDDSNRPAQTATNRPLERAPIRLCGPGLCGGAAAAQSVRAVRIRSSPIAFVSWQSQQVDRFAEDDEGRSIAYLGADCLICALSRTRPQMAPRHGRRRPEPWTRNSSAQRTPGRVCHLGLFDVTAIISDAASFRLTPT